MSKRLEGELGRVTIANEVIAAVAGKAATQCYGIVGMASRNLQDGLAELLGGENLARGVEVEVAEEKVSLTLYVIVQYGVRISEVARNVQERVRYLLVQNLGLEPKAVNIVVQGVRVTEPEPAKQPRVR